MSGAIALPEIFTRLAAADNLQYWWLLTFDMSRGSMPGNWIWGRRLNQYFKQILWYYKPGGEKPAALIKTDWVRCPGGHNGKDKRFHKWSQMETGILALCQKLAGPGELIVDPFVGGGTTAIAALALGCDFIGADIDAEAVETTRRRILEYQPVMPGCGFPQQNVTKPQSVQQPSPVPGASSRTIPGFGRRRFRPSRQRCGPLHYTPVGWRCRPGSAGHRRRRFGPAGRLSAGSKSGGRRRRRCRSLRKAGSAGFGTGWRRCC